MIAATQVDFQGTIRQVANVRKTESGWRVCELVGPRVSYIACERPIQPGTFMVLNSRNTVVGTLVERGEELIEARLL